jgi:hypothetical protein
MQCIHHQHQHQVLTFLLFSFHLFKIPKSLAFWILSTDWNSKWLENTTFQKLDLFLSSGDGRETPTLLGPLGRANLNQWTNVHGIWDLNCIHRLQVCGREFEIALEVPMSMHNYSVHVALCVCTDTVTVIAVQGVMPSVCKSEIPKMFPRSNKRTMEGIKMMMMMITTLWNWVPLERSQNLQPLGSFPTFYGNRARPIQSITPNPIANRSILILSIHIRLGLPSGLFPSDFPTNNIYTFLFCPHSRHMSRPPHPPRLGNSNYTII